MSIAERLSEVNERIAKAAAKCGRDPKSIKLIAVSKTKSVEEITEAVAAGQLTFGENYAQELRDKSAQLSTIALSHHRTIAPEWHFIGHLQKNKIKYVLPVASWIHTIDSVELLEAIGKWQTPSPSPLPLSHQGRGNTVTPNYLIEVNIAGEDSKSGVVPDKVFPLIEVFQTIALSNHRTIALKGLMCMPPVSDNPEDSRPYFKKLRDLLNEINLRSVYPVPLTELSMGMTHDFEIAIEEGATMVRIGTAIFGERASGFASASERGMGGRSEV